MNRNFTDLLNLLSKLSLRRIFNIIKVFSGFYLSRMIRKPIVFGLPVSVSIEPTTSCNLRCPECPSGLRSFSRPTGMMDPVLAGSIIDQLHKDIFYLIFYFQGEPFLHPELLKMVSQATKKNLYTAVSTNAHYITPQIAEGIIQSGLDRLIISLDGITQEVYEKYRVGGKLEKVLTGARHVMEAKARSNSRRPYVVFQFLVTGENEHQIDSVKNLSAETGIPVAFKTAQIYDYEKGHPLIPKNERFSRYRKQSNGTYKIKNPLNDHCWRLWNSSVITWDGKVVPCCFDKDAGYPMGNCANTPFSVLWKNEQYLNFRQAVLHSRKQIDICSNCSEGTKVWS